MSARAKSRKSTRSPSVKDSSEPRVNRRQSSGPPGNGVRRPAPATTTTQAKARAKARKAKAPKPVRTPLRERLLARLASVDVRPRTLAAKVPFVVLVIGALGLGLAMTLWLSTHSAERSYELSTAREKNRMLVQQKEALERDVLEAQAAPALAEAARELGMIPSKDTAHLVRDPAGNWVVVGEPKPAQGAAPPPLNTPLPEPTSPPSPVDQQEVMVRVPSPTERPLTTWTGPQVMLPLPLTDIARAPSRSSVPAPAPPGLTYAPAPGLTHPPSPRLPQTPQLGDPSIHLPPGPTHAPPLGGALTPVLPVLTQVPPR